MSTESRLYTFEQMLCNGISVKVNDKFEMRKISRLLIPMIQRPYAQGRRSQESIRKKFLADIFQVLADPDAEKLELNFLYGTFVEQEGDINVFELLDGQQRITTLFLLHWYFANMERANNSSGLPEYLSKFDYQTRTTSSDFIKKLVSFPVRTDIKPSKAIRGNVWYSKSYDKDTTVDSMLRMLDSIHSSFMELDVKPSYADLCKLRFYVIELDGFGLTEELFIKMNARGLQLTPFENFKADLVGFMKKDPRYKNKVRFEQSRIERKVEYWLNFSSLVDGKWTDLFWSRPQEDDDSGSKECDVRFFRFIQRFFANKAILSANKRGVQNDPFVQFFSNNIEIARHGSFGIYEAFFEKGKMLEKDFVRELEHILHFLVSGSVGKILLDGLKAPWEDTLGWKPWGTLGDVGQRQMILFSAMCEFVGKVDVPENFNTGDYMTWMRFVHSMVHGSDINGLDAQITLTRMLQDILSLNLGDDGLIPAYTDPRSAVVKYNSTHTGNRYLAAEALKAQQVLCDISWDEVFVEAEKNGFMQGSCMFYYQAGMDIATYRRRTRNVPVLFDKDGVKSPFAENYLLMRAVICRNYDWSSFRKGAYNFTVTNRNNDRYLRNLTIWNDSAPVKDLFCRLLDCTCETKIKEILAEVVAEDHKILLKPDYWSSSAVEMLQKGYSRLFKEADIMPMKWLYELGERSMGVYIYDTGNMALYKGNVNCMYLSVDRHKYIPQIVAEYKDTFGFEFDDVRQSRSYDAYCNYTGETICLTSTPGILPHGIVVKLAFYSNGAVMVSTSSSEYAKELNAEYVNAFGLTVNEDNAGKTIAYPDGNMSSWFEGKTEYFRVAYIADVATKKFFLTLPVIKNCD